MIPWDIGAAAYLAHLRDHAWTEGNYWQPIEDALLQQFSRRFVRLVAPSESLTRLPTEEHRCICGTAMRVIRLARAVVYIQPVKEKEPEMAILIDPDTWASIVAFVSHRGESGETYREARALHGHTQMAESTTGED